MLANSVRCGAGTLNGAAAGRHRVYRVLDVIPLVTAVDQLADRLRAMPHSTLRRGAADAGRTLAEQLAQRAQRLEATRALARSASELPRTLPHVEDFSVGDQLAVAGHDLAEALAAFGTRQQLAEAQDLLAEGSRTVR